MKPIKGLEHQRWFIWAIVALIVSGVALLAYINYSIKLDDLAVDPVLPKNKVMPVVENSATEKALKPGWAKANLPAWDMVAFAHPTDWSVKFPSDTSVELSKGTEKIYVYYYGDPSLTNPKPGQQGSEEKVMAKYINSLKNILSEGPTPEQFSRGGDSRQVQNSANGKETIHVVFFIGTLLIDVYTPSPPNETYAEVIQSFHYLGF